MAEPTDPDSTTTDSTDGESATIDSTASGSSDRPVTVTHLEVNEVRDGLIVYDATRDRVHYLNATASVVFTLCDGDHPADTMADEVAALFGVDPPRAEVADCLSNFAAEGLLQ